jgi:hypothetical protein
LKQNRPSNTRDRASVTVLGKRFAKGSIRYPALEQSRIPHANQFVTHPHHHDAVFPILYVVAAERLRGKWRRIHEFHGRSSVQADVLARDLHRASAAGHSREN